MRERIEPLPGQESVWDYPRPPRVEKIAKRVRIVFNGVEIVNTGAAFRVLETSHPPGYYVPQTDTLMQYLTATTRTSFCEFKGMASYWTVQVGDKVTADAVWMYATPNKGYAEIKDHLAFYPGRMDACFVGDERVQAQAGDFYGGWITSEIVGPFKGGAGTWGW